MVIRDFYEIVIRKYCSVTKALLRQTSAREIEKYPYLDNTREKMNAIYIYTSILGDENSP